MSKIKRGFTLFELLLVLLLIVVLYGLFAQNFSLNKNETENVKFERLNLYLSEKFMSDKKKVSLKCINDCAECRVLLDNNDTNITLDIFDKNANINAYKYDGKRFEKIEFDDWHPNEYDREKVCFSLDVYPNGSNDKIAVEYRGKIYLFENYLDENRVFDSLGELQDFAQKYQRETI